MNVELVGLDRQRLFELQIIRRVVKNKIEALQEVNNSDLDLLPSERAALKIGGSPEGRCHVERLTMQPLTPYPNGCQLLGYREQ